MEQDLQYAKLYAIKQENGEEIELGTITSIPEIELNSEGFEVESEGCEVEIELELPLITKKRFVKLLMGYGVQKRKTIKFHDSYMQRYRHRTKAGLIILLSIIN